MLNVFDTIAVLLTLAAVFSYINHRFIGLPTTIGLMALALATSLGLVALGTFLPSVHDEAVRMLEAIDFNKTLLHGMLGYLLFAGALHVDLNDLRRHGIMITSLATIGILISTTVVGSLTCVLLSILGINLPLIYCLLFGALISPTDPISVMAILRSVGAPKDLETQITGESLFNDGIGVVVFLALLAFATVGQDTSDHVAHLTAIAVQFSQEVLGGATFGLAIGLAAYWMLKSVNNYQVEVLISLALVTGGYALAHQLHLSGPIAIVVAGLLIGNHGRALAMSDITRQHLDAFWELVDEILNAVLFVLLGLEVLVLWHNHEYLLAGLATVPVVLLARFIAVGIPTTIIRAFVSVTPHVVKLMTWGGLRGGISVALALSLREHLGQGSARASDLILVMTYVVVVFSILVQGLSLKFLTRRWI